MTRAMPPRWTCPSRRMRVAKTSLTCNGLRIGVPDEYFIAGIQPEVEQAVRRAVADDGRTWAREVEEISLPHTEYALPVYYLIAPAEASANLARYDGVRFGLRAEAETCWVMFTAHRAARALARRSSGASCWAPTRFLPGITTPITARRRKVRTLIKRDFEQAFEQVDVIAAPVAPTTAFRIGEHGDDPLAMYLEDVFTLPANLAGVPGLAFPVGFDGQGLPIGMQLMGAHFREDVLLRTAYAYQQVTGIRF